MTALGVVGAGTMGAGIAQIALVAGRRVALYDPQAEALAAGAERVLGAIERGNAKGRWTLDAATARDALVTGGDVGVLAGCEVVIEAAPERLELKHAVLREVAAVTGPDAVLASNTSSIPLTLIAAGVPEPARVVGLHFFNPVPVMRLVEVIPAIQTSAEVVDRTVALGVALGKQVIVAPDSPGFLVNRCGRPFYAEALRLLQERIADAATIDRICRIGGGFRMGPFELMDLVGIDVGLAVATSFTELSFGEPRWRPSPLQARMVAAGYLGRKTGRGWYEYAADGSYRVNDPEPGAVGGGDGRSLAIVGEGRLAVWLRARAACAGFVVSESGGMDVVATLFADPDAGAADVAGAVRPIVSCASGSLGARGLTGVVGFNLAVLPSDDDAGLGPLVELARGAGSDRSGDVPDDACACAEAVFAALGTVREWVGDGPGLVLGRLLAQVVNEGAFAVGEGVGSDADIDLGVRLGLNYPRGPIEWGDLLGWDHVEAVLDGVWQERREERYRPAPELLRRGRLAAVSGTSLCC